MHPRIPQSRQEICILKFLGLGELGLLAHIGELGLLGHIGELGYPGCTGELRLPGNARELGYPGQTSPTTGQPVQPQTKIYSPGGSMTRATGEERTILPCS